VVLLVGGSPGSAAWKIAYAVFATAFFAWLLHLNRRAVATELQPRLQEMDRMLATLRNDREEPQAK
jgi:hypothetical protein